MPADLDLVRRLATADHGLAVVAATRRNGSVHLQEMAENPAAALSSYRAASRRTTSLPEQRDLEARAARLSQHDG